MEILFYYTILAGSFSIMYMFMYTIPIIHITQDVAVILELELKEEFNMGIYIIAVFISTTLFMPIFIRDTLNTDKLRVLKNYSDAILERIQK